MIMHENEVADVTKELAEITRIMKSDNIKSVEHSPLCRLIRRMIEDLEDYTRQRLVTAAEKQQSQKGSRTGLLLYHPTMVRLKRENGCRPTDQNKDQRSIEETPHGSVRVMC